MINAYKILVGKPKERSVFGRYRHSWEKILKLFLAK
jgi:hypothetical protein